MRLSQSAAYELEGLFYSPLGDHPKWALMLTMYVDESIDSKSGLCVVAGYLGKRKQWATYIDAWEKARGERESLHLATMRLGSKRAKARHQENLERLGFIPAVCGLKPIVGSIRHSDYLDLVKGTVSEVILAGYPMALIAMLDEMAKHLAKDERVEVVFEQQATYAAQRERAMILWNRLPHHRVKRDKGIVAKWLSMEKGILTEASDYLCYAIVQRDKDKNSQKAKLTSPILDSQPYFRNHISKDQIHEWLEQTEAKGKKPLRLQTPDSRKILRGRTGIQVK